MLLEWFVYLPLTNSLRNALNPGSHLFASFFFWRRVVQKKWQMSACPLLLLNLHLKECARAQNLSIRYVINYIYIDITISGC